MSPMHLTAVPTVAAEFSATRPCSHLERTAADYDYEDREVAPAGFAPYMEILLVEDNPGDVRLIREMLADVPGLDSRIQVSESLADTISRLRASRADVVLLDLTLPDSPGRETFRRLRAHATDVPVVVLTALNDEALAVAALQEGAQDYLVKGQVDGKLLAHALRHAIERKRLLLQLEAERRWLSTVIDRSPVGILLLKGADGARAVANQRARSLLGLPNEAPGSALEYSGEVCRPDGAPLADEDVPSNRALRGEIVVGEEFLVRRPDGRQVPVAVYASQIRDANEMPCGAVVIFDDMTVFMELERLREEWTAVIAHDLRQPVTVISAYAGLLAVKFEQSGALGPEKQWTEHIRTSAWQLNRLIADLLDVSRLEAGRLSLQPQPVDLPRLVNQVVERAETSGQIPVRLKIPPGFPPVNADPVRIEQVLGNLLSNAARYGYPNTEVLVELVVLNDHVQVAVANRGDGIAPGELPELFARFHRTDHARSERTEGLGLGLYISKGLIEAHGGQIWVESSPGETTVFRFTLPLDELTAAPHVVTRKGSLGAG